MYGGGSPPLGAPSGERGEAEVDIPLGSLLVLYSDGMVEDRETGLEPGSHRPHPVRDAAGGPAPTQDLEPIADALLGAADRPGRDDDITLLLARRNVHQTGGSSSDASGCSPEHLTRQ